MKTKKHEQHHKIGLQLSLMRKTLQLLCLFFSKMITFTFLLHQKSFLSQQVNQQLPFMYLSMSSCCSFIPDSDFILQQL